MNSLNQTRRPLKKTRRISTKLGRDGRGELEFFSCLFTRGRKGSQGFYIPERGAKERERTTLIAWPTSSPTGNTST